MFLKGTLSEIRKVIRDSPYFLEFIHLSYRKDVILCHFLTLDDATQVLIPLRQFLEKSLMPFWFIIDHHLKGVFPLETIINFDLVNSDNLLSIRFSQDNSPNNHPSLSFGYPFNPEWPLHYRAVDNMGRETIMTAREM